MVSPKGMVVRCCQTSCWKAVPGCCIGRSKTFLSLLKYSSSCCAAVYNKGAALGVATYSFVSSSKSTAEMYSAVPRMPIRPTGLSMKISCSSIVEGAPAVKGCICRVLLPVLGNILYFRQRGLGGHVQLSLQRVVQPRVFQGQGLRVLREFHQHIIGAPGTDAFNGHQCF